MLNSNLNSTGTGGNLITIAASNMLLDLQNHYVARPAGNTSQMTFGIYAVGQSSLTVQDGTISYCEIAIDLAPTASTNNVAHRIDNLRINHCTDEGIDLGNAPSARITDCHVTEVGGSSFGSASAST